MSKREAGLLWKGPGSIVPLWGKLVLFKDNQTARDRSPVPSHSFGTSLIFHFFPFNLGVVENLWMVIFSR